MVRSFLLSLLILHLLLGAGCEDNTSFQPRDSGTDGKKRDGKSADYNAQSPDGARTETAIYPDVSVKTETGTVKTEAGTVKTEAGTVKTEAGTVKTEAGTVKTEAGTAHADTGGVTVTEGGIVIKKDVGGVTVTEGGIVIPKDSSVTVTEGGIVIKKDVGGVTITEGGIVIPKDSSVTVTEGGIVIKKDTGAVVTPDIAIKLDGPVAIPDGPKKDVPLDFQFGEGKDVSVDHPTTDAKPDAPPDIYLDQPTSGDAAKQDAATVFADGQYFVPDTTVGKSESGKCLCLQSTGVGPCECNDGIDNDGDGRTDYPNDPDCGSPCDNSESTKPQCSDGIDNDGDGKIDAADLECTGPLDNDESSYGTNIPGDNIDCKEDCFFDGNSGSGNDKCLWPLQCDPLNPAPALPCPKCKCVYDPTYKGCPANQTAQCLNVCLPLTPNGCDCFGCCLVSNGTISRIIKLNTNCTMANLADNTKCPACTQVKDCLNTCGKCDWCIGKPPDPSCFPDSGPPWPKDMGVPKDQRIPDKWQYDAPPPKPDQWVYDAMRPDLPRPDLPIPPDMPKPDKWPYDAAPPDQPKWPFDAKAADGWYNPFCAPGIPYCGNNPALCPAGTWCLTGCCIKYEI